LLWLQTADISETSSTLMWDFNLLLGEQNKQHQLQHTIRDVDAGPAVPASPPRTNFNDTNWIVPDIDSLIDNSMLESMSACDELDLSLSSFLFSGISDISETVGCSSPQTGSINHKKRRISDEGVDCDLSVMDVKPCFKKSKNEKTKLLRSPKKAPQPSKSPKSSNSVKSSKRAIITTTPADSFCLEDFFAAVALDSREKKQKNSSTQIRYTSPYGTLSPTKRRTIPYPPFTPQ